jgi:transmembrane 9 superfamily protein 2/4
MRAWCLAVVAAVAAVPLASGYYLPGIKPISYEPGDIVSVDVNGLHSNTALLPFEYYTLPFCKPAQVDRKHETLGEILMGDRIETSNYEFRMAQDTGCQLLQCTKEERAMDAAKLAKLEKFIESNYRAYMVLDNLPVFNNGSLVYQGQCKAIPKSEQYEFLRGYALGVTKKCTGDKTLINNHLQFNIQYHKHTATEYRVVGFTATPYSIKHTADGASCTQDMLPDKMAETPLTTEADKTNTIYWSYGVKWTEEPTIMWASRWDSYLHTSFADVNSRVHWFSIINSMLIVFCLMCVTLLVLVRSLRRDFARYNEILSQLESKETAQEESGWKIVYKWVVVPPSNVRWLVVAVANGMQLVGMAVTTLFFACLGFLSPANRGALLGAVLLLYVIQSLFAGYVCGRMLKRFAEKSWVPVFATGMLLPALFFGVFTVLNLISWSQSTRTAVPALTVVALLTLWLGISLPLTVLGAAFGFSAEPSRTDDTKAPPAPRPVPMQEWYLQDWACLLFPPMVAFGATFLELRFILASLWQGMVYYVFGFLSIVFVLWVCCCALATIVVVYYRLCAENYNWWWMSFFASNGAGLHLLAYSIFYFATQLSVTSTTGTLMYACYMGLMTVVYVLASGSIGFVATYYFQRQIYSAVKRD